MPASFASHGGTPRSPHPGTERREGRIGARNFALDDFRGLSVEEAAELIRHEPVEHAVIYSRAGKALYYKRSWPGDPYRVTVPIGRSGLIRGNVFVHNHPGSESFSAEDIWILLRHGAREVRAYGPKRAFPMIGSPKTLRFGVAGDDTALAVLRARYGNALMRSAPMFETLVQERILTESEALVSRTHGALRELSSRYRFAYMEI